MGRGQERSQLERGRGWVSNKKTGGSEINTRGDREAQEEPSGIHAEEKGTRRGDSDKEPERQNLSEKIQRQRLRNETLREEMMRRGREGGREDRNGGTGLYRAAALSS